MTSATTTATNMMRVALVALLLCALAGLGGAQGEISAQTKKKAPKEPKCDANAAYDLVMSTHEAGLHAELVALITCRRGWQSYFKSKLKGKAYLMPHNNAVLNAIAAAGLHTKHSTVNMCKAPLSKQDDKALKEALANGVVTTRTFRTKLNRWTDCNLVASVYDHTKGLDALMSHEALPGGPPKYAHRHGSSGGGSGRRLLQNSAFPNSIGRNIGMGYNALRGMPASTTGSSVDPGLYQTSVFNTTFFDPSVYPTLPYTYAVVAPTSACASSLYSSQTASYAATTSKMATAIGLSGAYNSPVTQISFSANVQVQQMTSGSQSKQSKTVISGATVALDTYTLNSINEIPLDSGFVGASATILNTYNKLVNGSVGAPGSTTYNSVLSNLGSYLGTLYATYGTHILHQINTGAVQNSIFQFSAYTDQQLSSMNVDVDATASVAFLEYSGHASSSVQTDTSSASYLSSQSSTKQYQVAPSGVDVPFQASTEADTPVGVDCVTWSQWLKGNDTDAAVNYNVVELVGIYQPSASSLDGLPGSWSYAGLDSDDLGTLNTLVSSYFTNCVPADGTALSGGAFATSACIPIPSTCNPGYSGSGGTSATACSPCGCGNLGCDADGNCVLPVHNHAWTPGLYGQQYLASDPSIFTGKNYEFTFNPTSYTWNANTQLGVSGKQYFDNSTAVCYVPWDPVTRNPDCHANCCEDYAIVWTGYFVPNLGSTAQTGDSATYWFQTGGDDYAFMWGGPNAIGGWNVLNAASGAGNPLNFIDNGANYWNVMGSMTVYHNVPIPVRLMQINGYYNDTSGVGNPTGGPTWFNLLYTTTPPTSPSAILPNYNNNGNLLGYPGWGGGSFYYINNNTASSDNGF